MERPLKNHRFWDRLYLINITRGSRQKYAEEFASSGFEPLPDRAEN